MVEAGSARQGEIYWVDFGLPGGSEPGSRRPAIVVQHDRFNLSALRTVVICPLTSRVDRSRLPGHVLVPMGETGLHRDSVSMPTLVTAVDLDQIAEYVGRLRAGRLREVIEGVQRVIEPPRLHAGQA